MGKSTISMAILNSYVSHNHRVQGLLAMDEAVLLNQRLALFFTASWNKCLSTGFMFPEEGDHKSARSLHYIKYKKKCMFKTKQSIYNFRKPEKKYSNPKSQRVWLDPHWLFIFFVVVFSRFWPLVVLAFFWSCWQNSCWIQAPRTPRRGSVSCRILNLILNPDTKSILCFMVVLQE